jgi:spore coat protein U-like protein
MKRISILIAVAVFLTGGACFALTSTQQSLFTVTVSSVFELSIDQGVIDFGRMRPGDVKWNIPSSGITVTARTNNGKPWYLKVSAATPFSFGSYMIPYSKFVWTGWTDGAGRWYGTGNNFMTPTPSLVYASGLGEENNLPNGTNNHFKFKLTVPENQAPGVYTTTVKFTMTE